MMTIWLLPPRSGATITNNARTVYTGTAGVPVAFEDADVPAAIAQGWTYSDQAPVEQLGKLIGIPEEKGTSNVIDWIKNYFSLSFEARVAYILSGATPFFPRYSIVQNETSIIPDGTDATALTNALNAAVARRFDKFVVLTQNMTIAANVTIPPNVTLIAGTYTITGSGGVRDVILSRGSKVVGGKFVSSIVSVLTTSGTTGFGVIGSWFENASTWGVYIATGDNTLHHNGVVVLSRFDNCAYGVNLYRVGTSLIAFNYFNNPDESSRHILGVNADKNLIEYNYFAGGRVGVLMMADRTNGPRGIKDNVIRRNYAERISEEAFSIDAQASSAALMGVYDRVFCFSTTGTASSNPTINLSRIDFSGSLATTNVLQVLTGPERGKTYATNFTSAPTPWVGTGTIVGTAFTVSTTTSGAVAIGMAVTGAGVTDGTRVVSGTNPNWVVNVASTSGSPTNAGSISFRLGAGGQVTTSELANLANQQFAIQIPLTNNSIVENTTYDCTTPVSLWGFSYGTVVTGNKNSNTRIGLGGRKTACAVSSLAGLNPTSRSVSANTINTNVSAPSFAQIYNNDWGDGIEHYRGVSYGNQPEAVAVTGVVGSMIHARGGNSSAQVVSKWENILSTWVSTAADPVELINSVGLYEPSLSRGWEMIDFPNYSPSSRIINSSSSTIFDDYTDSSATTGATQSTALRGRLSVAAAATSVVLTNLNITPTTQMILSLATNDSTAVIRNYVCGNGTVTINLTAPTATTNIDWAILM